MQDILYLSVTRTLPRELKDLTDLLPSKPLYEKIKTLIIQKIIDGRWEAGERLPNEFQLGEEFGVSQGTVRKALEAMTREGLVVRHQGKGTYVAEHDPQQSLFKFFHLISDGKDRALPESRIFAVREDEATAAEQELLFFETSTRVFRIRRIRFLSGVAAIVETIIVPNWLIRNKVEAQTLPNTAYRYYQRERGVTVARAIEKLRAVLATEEEAELLELAPATPLLEINRTAVDLQGRAIEQRISRCRTDGYHYLAR